MSKGYVYILTNPYFRKGIVKIGRSQRPVNTRAKELYNTSVPDLFEVFASISTAKFKEVENLIHAILTKLTHKRVNEKREFFKIKPEAALDVFRDVAKVIDDAEIVVKGEPSKAPRRPRRPHLPLPVSPKVKTKGGKPQSNKSIAPDKAEKRVMFRFSDYGIKPGEYVYFRKDVTKYAVVVDDRHVRYGDDITSLSALAKVLLGRKSGVHGQLHFTYNGILLTELERKMKVGYSSRQNQATSTGPIWKNVTQLAKYLARQGGNEGAAGGVGQLLTAKRPCHKSSKWRQPMEDIGIRFDEKDFVIDWRCAKKEGGAKLPSGGAWKNPTQLAKAISAKFNAGKSKDHIRFLLVGERPVPPGSQYRESFESIGLSFDANNRVVDWHSARRW